MNKKTYITPALKVVKMQHKVGILAGSGDQVYGDTVGGSYQMSRRHSDWDNEDDWED